MNNLSGAGMFRLGCQKNGLLKQKNYFVCKDYPYWDYNNGEATGKGNVSNFLHYMTFF